MQLALVERWFSVGVLHYTIITLTLTGRVMGGNIGVEYMVVANDVPIPTTVRKYPLSDSPGVNPPTVSDP